MGSRLRVRMLLGDSLAIFHFFEAVGADAMGETDRAAAAEIFLHLLPIAVAVALLTGTGLAGSFFLADLARRVPGLRSML